MIIKIFKINTKEMWTMRNKMGLIKFIYHETGYCLSNTMTINQIIKYLPKENYYRIK